MPLCLSTNFMIGTRAFAITCGQENKTFTSGRESKLEFFQNYLSARILLSDEGSAYNIYLIIKNLIDQSYWPHTCIFLVILLCDNALARA